MIDTAITQGVSLSCIAGHTSDRNVQRSIHYATKYSGHILVLAGTDVSTAHGHVVAYFSADRAQAVRTLVGSTLRWVHEYSSGKTVLSGHGRIYRTVPLICRPLCITYSNVARRRGASVSKVMARDTGGHIGSLNIMGMFANLSKRVGVGAAASFRFQTDPQTTRSLNAAPQPTSVLRYCPHQRHEMLISVSG
jgi:hypothetical protein